MDSLCKLTIVYPPSAADGLVELILGIEPPIGGFTTLSAEGHGFSFANATIGERVRGRVDRQMLIAIMGRAEAEALLELVRTELPVPHIAYWLEPVLHGGRLVQGPPNKPPPAPLSTPELEIAS